MESVNRCYLAYLENEDPSPIQSNSNGVPSKMWIPLVKEGFHYSNCCNLSQGPPDAATLMELSPELSEKLWYKYVLVW